MNIKTAIYENLTSRQRLAAGIDAISRGDEAEWQKLRSTCPKRTYKMEDHRFMGAYQVLTARALAVEQILTAAALSMILFDRAGDHEQAGTYLQGIVDVCAAWQEHLQGIGISPKTMHLTMQGIRHPMITSILERNPDTLPEPDPGKVQEYREAWDHLFSAYQ